MSEFRRKLLTQQESQQQDYIQNGLLMYLDCLDSTNCANNYWKDPVHNIVFTGNSEYTERGFKFNGPNSGTYLLSNTSFMNNILSNMILTVEVVVETLTNSNDKGILFVDGDWDNLQLMVFFENSRFFTWAYKPNYGYTQTTNGYRFIIPENPANNKKFVISEAYGGKNSNLEYAYYNKIQLTQVLENSGVTHRHDKMAIGAREAYGSGSIVSSNITLNGYIKCIRLYNRQLTAEEILHNQAIDNERYNLGL